MKVIHSVVYTTTTTIIIIKESIALNEDGNKSGRIIANGRLIGIAMYAGIDNRLIYKWIYRFITFFPHSIRLFSFSAHNWFLYLITPFNDNRMSGSKQTICIYLKLKSNKQWTTEASIVQKDGSIEAHYKRSELANPVHSVCRLLRLDSWNVIEFKLTRAFHFISFNTHTHTHTHTQRLTCQGIT